MKKVHLLSIALLLPAAACKDTHPGPIAPEFAVSAPALGSVSQSSARRTHHVMGSVYLNWAVYGGGRDMYSFNAAADGAGNVHGFFQSEYAYELDEPGGFRFRAEVVCLAVDGNEAWLGLRIARSEDPDYFAVGTEAVIRLRDGGEGGHIGEPEPGEIYDGIGHIVIRSAATCAQKPRTAEFSNLWFIDYGNIQIR